MYDNPAMSMAEKPGMQQQQMDPAMMRRMMMARALMQGGGGIGQAAYSPGGSAMAGIAQGINGVSQDRDTMAKLFGGGGGFQNRYE